MTGDSSPHSSVSAHKLHGRPRSRRLRKDADIRAVFQRGHSAHTKSLSVYALPDPSGITRTTVVAGKKVGGAVQRNLAKRRLRAALQVSRLPEGYDVVVVARSRCLAMPFADLLTQISEQVRRSASACQNANRS